MTGPLPAPGPITLPTVDPRRRDAVVDAAGRRPVVVHYTAASCGPCARFAPAVARLAADADDRWHVVSVDLDDHPGAGSRHGVRSVPSVVIVVDGVVRDRLTGVHDVSELRTAVGRFVDDPATTSGDRRG